MKIYVGNLSFQTTEDRLRELFEEHGQVASATLVMDRETGRPRGFGFVEMNDAGEAQNAINALNGQNIDGRDLTVNEARPREDRGGFGGGGGRAAVGAAVWSCLRSWSRNSGRSVIA
ncbi:MAG: RNA-binding protein, partial [Phycisphaerales bacterium]|nr:RNA-binding protein [Phycisphaerales bacterium]